MSKMIGLGSKFPKYKKTACVSVEMGKEFAEITSNDHRKDGKWMVMFWYPKDFTFICPTEIVEFSNYNAKFKERNTVLIGASTDTEFSHLGWRMAHPELKKIEIPLLADTSKSLAKKLGILAKPELIAYRATYIVNPEGDIMWVSVNDLDTGRNVDEVIRVLDGLQSGGLAPCGWTKGDDLL